MRILIITGGRIDEDFALSLLEKENQNYKEVVQNGPHEETYKQGMLERM